MDSHRHLEEEMQNHYDFKYTPLVGPLAIRLLELHAGQSGDDINCTILPDSLENGRAGKNYIALSYTWGDLLSTRIIFCNDARFQITRNLEGALRELRWQDESRILWIDQICINQTDNDERCAQVQIMRDIYQGADRVIAWLGESAADTDVAVQFIETFDQNFTEISGSLNSSAEILSETPKYLNSGLLHANEPGWRALANLFARIWFSRVWVIQEAMLAKDLVLQCGSQQMSWEKVLRIGAKIEHREYAKALVFFNPQTTCARFMLLWIPKLNTKQTITLHNLLGAFVAHDSTNPRDKIYALLGLIRNNTNFGIIPNYNILVDELFRTVGTVILNSLQTLRCLDIFPPSTLNKRLSTFPSWCPDWSREAHDEFAGGPITNAYEFHADGDAEANMC
jgi:hypothetical protein